MSQTKDFRAYISNWIDENCPKSMMTPMPASEQVWAHHQFHSQIQILKNGLMQ